MMSDDATKEVDSSLADNVYDRLFNQGMHDDNSGEVGDYPTFDLYLDWYRSSSTKVLSINYPNPVSGKLIGHLLRHPIPTKRTALVIHGITSMWQNTGAWVRAFYDMGFNVFTPNLRGHGKPDEKFTDDRTMGIYDCGDMISWVEELTKIFGAGTSIVIMGYSLGAAVALQTISCRGLPPGSVKAIVADSAFEYLPGDLGAVMHEIVSEQSLDLPNEDSYRAYAEVNDLLYKKQSAVIDDGITPNKIKYGLFPAAPFPLMIFYGQEDVLSVAAVDIYQNYVGTIKGIYGAPNANHIQAIAVDYEVYRQRLRGFLIEANILPYAITFDPDVVQPQPESFPYKFPSYSKSHPTRVIVDSAVEPPNYLTLSIVDNNVGAQFKTGPTATVEMRYMTVSGRWYGQGAIPDVTFTGGNESGTFSIAASAGSSAPQISEIRTYTP